MWDRLPGVGSTMSNCVQSEDILEKVDVNIQPESHQCGVRHLESSC